MCRLSNEGRSGRLKQISESYCVVIFDDRSSCLYTFAHTRAIRSARTVPPQEPIDIPDWTKIQPGSVTQNWKHFTRDGDRGVTFREYGAINYAVSVIGAGRARAQNLVRALRSSLAFISYVRVYVPSCMRRHTIAHDFVTIAPFCSAGRVDPH